MSGYLKIPIISSGSGAVDSVNGQTGIVTITKSDISLGNVNNTADIDKPVSTAQQTALDLKADLSLVSNIDNTSDANKPISTATQTALNLKADSATVTSSLALKLNKGTNVLHVGVGREYTTIQSALNAIGNATNLADNQTPYTVYVDGGTYDEDLTIPSGRIIALLAQGTVILGNGAGASNWTSTNSRNITTQFNAAQFFSGNTPRPAFTMGVAVPSDATSTFISHAGTWKVSGGLIIGGDSPTHTIVLHSVEINGTVTKTTAGLTNFHAYRSYFKGVFNAPTSTILSRIDHCQFDALITVDGYNEIRNSEIKAGMTVTANQNTLPPSGIFNTTLTGTFTGPANSLKLDGTSHYFFITNGATLGGSATKVLLKDNPARIYTAGIDATTLQGTIDLAYAQNPTLSSAVIVQVPPKVNGWTEDITLKDSVYVKAMGNLHDTSCVIINGSITFAPTAANAVTARSSIQGFQITKSTTSAVITMTGSNAGQLSIIGCYIQNSNADTATAACIQNNNTGGASIYSYGNQTYMSGTAGQGGTHYNANGGTIYVMDGCEMNGGTKFINVAAGKYLQCIYSYGSLSGPDGVTVAASGLVTIGWSTLANLSTNGNLVNLTASGAVAGITNSYLEAQNGTGYLITGVAGSIYTFANNITGNVAGIQTRNVKIKNTVTAVAYTATLTSTP